MQEARWQQLGYPRIPHPITARVVGNPATGKQNPGEIIIQEGGYAYVSTGAGRQYSCLVNKT